MSDLSLVAFDRDGLTLYVNPDDVSTVQEIHTQVYGTQTLIVMRTGARHAVSDPIGYVVDKLTPKFVLG